MGISVKFSNGIVSKGLCVHNLDKYLQIIGEYLFTAVLFRFFTFVSIW